MEQPDTTPTSPRTRSNERTEQNHKPPDQTKHTPERHHTEENTIPYRKHQITHYNTAKNPQDTTNPPIQPTNHQPPQRPYFFTGLNTAEPPRDAIQLAVDEEAGTEGVGAARNALPWSTTTATGAET